MRPFYTPYFLLINLKLAQLNSLPFERWVIANFDMANQFALMNAIIKMSSKLRIRDDIPKKL